ncbi:cupin domain-containing protein [Cytophagaceae bacterium YF14B1]|uniref:Cupin domain-containing protein n=1 Tax=Xanthocytophaga flava TaxID=3048013 RepID=A0AAE3U5C6_9BACT|nr:cupin domain-containing protein [Xanthocytophaga flavus]MDJ1479402.1 cupin domain-containing protein [Xanthocytophaga flavus]
MHAADYWIQKLHLQPHPEGGYFSETYRSAESINSSHLPDRYKGARSFSTGIYFLVEGGQFSSLHRIQSDEMWHFYAGTTLTVYAIDPTGNLHTIRLGSDPEKGEVFQAVVPAGYWFGSVSENADGFALVGCTVAPGFDFADFELAKRQDLMAIFPQHQKLIERLTRE